MRLPLLTIVLGTMTASLLSACGTTTGIRQPSESSSVTQRVSPSNDAVEGEAKGDMEGYNERIAVVAKDIRAICTAPTNQAYYSKTPCLPSGMTQAHLKDASRLTPQAKAVTKRIFEQLHDLNEETRSLMMKSGNPQLIELARQSREIIDPQIKTIQNALLEGRMTWGEYNRARLEIFESSSDNAPTEP